MRFAPVVALLVLALAGCTPAIPDARQRYETWRQGPEAAGLSEYERLLARAGVADAVPMHALLRSSRRWESCQAPEFLLPPPEHADAIVPTLRLVRDLAARGLVDPEGVRSGYRPDALNRCSGGSPRSRHRLNEALDFDLPDATRVAALCAFWRDEGRRHAMGLGFYTPTRIHVDAAGHRTWGSDHHRGSSLCLSPQAGADQRLGR